MTLRTPQTIARSSEPLTNSVANTLRELIQSGHYKAGDWLPTERALAEELGVDRRVVRTAVNQLVRSGHAIRQPHCRPIVGVVEPSAPVAATPAAVASPTSTTFMALLMCHGSEQIERAFNSQQRIFWGMNQALASAGHHAVFLDLQVVKSEEENATREAEHLRYLLKHGFGGAVFYPYAYRSNAALVREVAAAIPFVTIDRQIDATDTDFVGVNNYQAMYDAIMHLVAQGHTRIAYVTKNESIRPVQERIQGYIAAVRDAGLVELVLSIPSFDLKQPWTAFDAVFRLPTSERPTAVASFNDYCATDVMRRLESFGLTVPGDVALTGFDDIVSTLPNGVDLTTVAQPYEAIGRKAAELLLQRLKDRSAPTRSVELPAELAVRDSSSVLRSM